MFFSLRLQLSLVAVMAIFDTSLAKTINVSSQGDFENLSTTIVEAIKSGDDIVTVNLDDGIYFYKNQHILLKGINNPSLSLHFTARNAVVKGQWRIVNNFSKYEYLYFKDQELVDSWTEFFQAKDTIEIVDTNNHVCRIKHDGLEDLVDVRNKKIQVTLGFKSVVFPLIKVEQGYVYFNAGEFATAINGYAMTINYDYAYAKKYPRYRLFGFTNTSDMYECRAACFLDLGDSSIKSLYVTGIVFDGCSRENHLIIINDIKAENIEIKNCSFSNIGGAVVYITNSDNVTFNNNKVKNTFGSAIVSNNGSWNTIVTNNEFRNLNLKMTNSHGVLIQGGNFTIEKNLFENFSYSAIGVGVHYKSKVTNPCSGIINDNEIFLSGDYLNRPEQHSLMDGGAIYLWTRNDGITIENNYIHDIVGMKENRGIFLDDGAYNVEICGNIITNIENSYCIDSRRVASIEKNGSRGYVTRTNINNKVYDNIVDGSIHFEPREGGKNGCLLGENYVAIGTSEKGIVKVSKLDYKKIRKKPLWKHIKEIVKVKDY